MVLQENYSKSTLAFFSGSMGDLLKRYDQVLFDNADKAMNENVKLRCQTIDI